MAFIVQDDTGEVANATSYGEVDDLRDYWSDRGQELITWSDTECQAALIRATQYIDLRFVYHGIKTNGSDQTTEWPRSTDTIIPVVVLQACYEYAFYSATIPLSVQAQSSDRLIIRERKKLEGMEKEVEYAGGKSAQRYNMYAIADALLQKTGCVASSGGCIRA